MGDEISLHMLTTAKSSVQRKRVVLLLWLLKNVLSNASNESGHSLCALQVHEASGIYVLWNSIASFLLRWTRFVFWNNRFYTFRS
jgi:hypothetical protein